jgi:hypothetical protein
VQSIGSSEQFSMTPIFWSLLSNIAWDRTELRWASSIGSSEQSIGSSQLFFYHDPDPNLSALG